MCHARVAARPPFRIYCLSRMTRSTLRLSARPVSVSFDATGRYPANPATDKREGSNLLSFTTTDAIDVARAADNSQFEGYATRWIGRLSVCPSMRISTFCEAATFAIFARIVWAWGRTVVSPLGKNRSLSG